MKSIRRNLQALSIKRRKISEELARSIMSDLSDGMRQCDAARKHGVEPKVIARVALGATYGDSWRHVGRRDGD